MTEEEPASDRAVARKKKLSVISQLIPSHCHHQITTGIHRLNPGALIRRHISIFGGMISGFLIGSTAGYSLSFTGNISIQRIKEKADDENDSWLLTSLFLFWGRIHEQIAKRNQDGKPTLTSEPSNIKTHSDNFNSPSPPSSSSRMEEIIRLEGEIRDLEQLYRRKVNELSQLVDE